jgi:hypothetical protein
MKKASLFILTCGLMLSVGLEAFANPIYIDNIEFDNNLVWPESDHSTIITDDFQWPEDWVITNEELKDALLERLYATKNIELIILFSLFLGVLPIYIYFSLVYMKLAQKIGVRPAWLAWIPIANIYLISKMAQRHWWPLLLILTFVIPFLNVITLMIFLTFNFFWHCRIFERVGRPAWWAVASLIPGFGSMVFLVMLSLAAWKEPAETI